MAGMTLITSLFIGPLIAYAIMLLIALPFLPFIYLSTVLDRRRKLKQERRNRERWRKLDESWFTSR